MLGRLLIVVLSTLALGGCGLTVPKISEVWEQDVPPSDRLLPRDVLSATAQIEFEIKKRIYCDLKRAVSDAQQIFYGEGRTKPTPRNEGFLPSDWGADVSLSLEVDETVSLSPGAALNQVMPNAIKTFGAAGTVTTPQSFALGFGANASSTATRTDRFDSYYTIGRLAKPIREDSICNPAAPTNDPIINAGYVPASASPFILESELGIKDWLIGSLYSTRAIPSDSAPGGGMAGRGGQGSSGSQGGGGGQSGGKMMPDTITIEIKFSIVSAGNLTPTWRLVRVSANTGTSAFFSVGRTRLHDLIITIGPSKPETTATHNTQVNGNTVGNAIRNATAPF